MSVTISLSYSSRSREMRCGQKALPTTAGAVFGVTLQEVPKSVYASEWLNTLLVVMINVKSIMLLNC